MSLSGAQIKELIDLVVAAFSRFDLKILVRVEFDERIDDMVATDAGWNAVVFELIDKFDQQDRIPAFARALVKARPNNTALCEFCRGLGLSNPGPQPGENDLRGAIGEFKKRFQDDLFKYLNAYKELHDVLHELQSFLPNITDAVKSRVANPLVELAEDVDFSLREWLTRAQRNAGAIEVPENPPKWIARLKTAVEEITREVGDPVKMSSQLKELKLLPSKGLGPLNEKLFEVAKRLKPPSLIEALDQILLALGADEAPAHRQLRKDAVAFRTLCVELDELSTAHNLCQKIDDVLREAPGLESVTPDELSDWNEAREALAGLVKLVEHKQADDLLNRRVTRTIIAADRFNDKQADAFTAFVERFDDLFMKTDKALLKVTNNLPLQAVVLNRAMETAR